MESHHVNDGRPAGETAGDTAFLGVGYAGGLGEVLDYAGDLD